MNSNIVDILEYVSLSKYERKREWKERERCASSELSEFSRIDLS